MYNLPIYTPHDWFWIVADDETRAWSSAVSAYVTNWPTERVTRIANEIELDSVLKAANLVGIVIDKNDIIKEMLRRQMLLIDANSVEDLQRKILTGTREATELQNIKIKFLSDPINNLDWTEGQIAMAAYLEIIENELAELEKKAEALFISLPKDYTNDKHWQ